MRKVYFNSPVILWFVILCTTTLALNYITGGWTNQMFFEVYRSPFSIGAVIRLFGHVLGHANFEHYSNNMMYILLVGPVAEEKYGSRRLTVLMVITALVTGLVQVILFPGTALLGASGIVFMLIMLTAVVGKGDRIPLTLVLVTVLYLGSQIIEGLTLDDGVSHITHIIGGIIGIAAGWKMRDKSTEEWE